MNLRGRDIAVVAQDGRKTFARLIRGSGITCGDTTCKKGDEFKPEIGAVIALCRAYQRHPAEVCYEVMSTLAHGKAEESARESEIRADEYVQQVVEDLDKRKGVPAGRIRRGELRLETPVEGMGKPGTPTKFKDVNGKVLFVGDLVTIKGLQGEVRSGRKWVDLDGLHFVVDEQTEDKFSSGQYIMGLLPGCNAKTGKIDGRCRVQLAKRWQEVEVGETHDGVRLVWEDKHE